MGRLSAVWPEHINGLVLFLVKSWIHTSMMLAEADFDNDGSYTSEQRGSEEEDKPKEVIPVSGESGVISVHGCFCHQGIFEAVIKQRKEYEWV